MVKPIFKMPKIKHPSDKARQDFIVDLIFLQVGGSLIHIGLTENFAKESEIKQIHKNKNRKEYKKVKELHDEMQREALKIREKLTPEDRATLFHKTTRLNSCFISKIGLTDKSLNLEYLGICVLDQGLNRKNRKTKRYEILDKFCDYKTLYAQIGETIEKAGISMDDEYEVAKDFVVEVKY